MHVQHIKSCICKRYWFLRAITGFTLIDRQPQYKMKRNFYLIKVVYIMIKEI